MAKPTCEVDECNDPVLAKKMCRKHYQRMRNKGSTEDRVLMTPEERAQSGRDAANRFNAANRELVRERSRQRYQDHREEELERRRQYTRDNPDKISEYNKRWRRENPGRATELWREWCKANPERAREIDARHRVKRRAAMSSTTVGPVSYRQVLEDFGMVCHICDAEIADMDDLHFDHVFPLSRGGPHVQENIRPAHADCNRRKSDKLMSELGDIAS